MSKLLFKVLANSYCRHHDQSSLLEDVLSLLTTKVQNLNTKIKQQMKQIKEVLSLPSEPQQNQMSVIIEQETQRSIAEGESYDKWVTRVKEEFNVQIGRLNKYEIKCDKLVEIYKKQLIQISTEMTKWSTKNQQLKKELKKIKQTNQKLVQQNSELKDQITIESAQLFINQTEDIESVFDSRVSREVQQKQQTPKFKIKNEKQKQKQKQKQRKSIKKQHVQQKQKPRAAPKPIIDHESSSQRRQQPNLIQISIREKQMDEDLHKWKKLSKKIDELKAKLVIYEDEIEQKDQTIKKLKNEIKQLKQQQDGESQQKRKIKTANTTLRGQKTVLQNQLTSLKKLLAEKSELCAVHESQIYQQKLQIQSLSESSRNQNTIINQLRQTAAKQHVKSQGQHEGKITKLSAINDKLIVALDRQEEELEIMNKRTKQIEELLQAKIIEMTGRIGQLELILDEKNQCIVRMKTKGFSNENVNPNVPSSSQNLYLNELVRVLTKKVADRDEIIKKLQQRA